MKASDIDRIRTAIANIKQGLVSEFSKELGERLDSMILFGSVARNDYIPGWSDLDVMVFLKGEKVSVSDLAGIRNGCERIVREHGTSDLDVYTFTKSICEKVINRCSRLDIGIHLLVYSEKEFHNGLTKHPDFPPLFLYAVCRDRECLYGTDHFQGVVLPDRIKPSVLLGSEAGLYDLRIRLRNVYLDYDMEQRPEAFARDGIYCVFSAARSSLLMRGISEFATTKEAIREGFERNFPDFPQVTLVGQALEFRRRYLELRSEVQYVRAFYDKAIIFIDGLIEYVLRHNDRKQEGDFGVL